MCSGPWILESAIFVSEWYLNWPFWDLVSEQFQKDSPIDNFSCYDNEPVTDNGELVCHECIDPINPYLDIDEDLDDDAFVHICSPGVAPTLSTKFRWQIIQDRRWIRQHLSMLWLRINLNVFQTWKKIFWAIRHWIATNLIIWSLQILIQLWVALILI